MYSFANMISDNTSILKADLAVGFPYRFDSSSFYFSLQPPACCDFSIISQLISMKFGMLIVLDETNRLNIFSSQWDQGTAGNLLIHSILLCSLNIEKNFLFWLRGVNITASERYVCTFYVWISFMNNYVNIRTCQFHIGKIYLPHRNIFQCEW